MFTGIVEHIGTVKQVIPVNTGKKIAVEIGHIIEGVKLGDSIAVNGLCLTVSSIADSVVTFDIVTESLNRSALGNLRAGSKVNLERALLAGGRLDGHIVQGHVDGIATLSSIKQTGACEMTFTADSALIDQLAPKGSITVAGVSLTVARFDSKSFTIAVIPTTLRETILKDLKQGQQVNIELDILGKYIKRYLMQMFASESKQKTTASNITLEKLRQQGFM